MSIYVIGMGASGSLPSRREENVGADSAFLDEASPNVATLSSLRPSDGGGYSKLPYSIARRSLHPLTVRDCQRAFVGPEGLRTLFERHGFEGNCQLPPNG